MTEKNLKLRFLCLATRHGDRAPVRFLRNDPNITFFPEGEGAVTKRGRTEMYNLGQVLRKRYDHFLGDKLFAKDVYVRSTAADRCLMSAQCLLAGLFRPMNDEDKLSPEVNWQPVSVHTESYDEDALTFRLNDDYEHPQTGSYEDPVSNELYQNMLKYMDLWNLIDNISNSKFISILNVVSVDTIVTEAQNNLEIPSKLQGRQKDVEELFYAFSHLYCTVHSRSRSVTASTLEIIVNRMEAFLQESNSSSSTAPKTLIFSFHDYNQMALAIALCKKNLRCPTASSLIFEVLEDLDSTSGDLYVKMWFLSKHDKDPVEMKFQIGADSSSQASIVSFTEFTHFVRGFVKKTRDAAQLEP